MPVGIFLHTCRKRDEASVPSGAADHLEADRHAAVVKADWNGDRRKSEHIDEAAIAAEII